MRKKRGGVIRRLKKHATRATARRDQTVCETFGLSRNAELLHKNSVETAKANQRLVIDISTLEKVQATLISTVEDVIRIQQEGVRSRHEAEGKLLTMRAELEDRLARRLPDKTAA